MIYLIIFWLVLGAYWVQSGRYQLKKEGNSLLDDIIVTPVILLFCLLIGIFIICAKLFYWIFK